MYTYVIRPVSEQATSKANVELVPELKATLDNRDGVYQYLDIYKNRKFI